MNFKIKKLFEKVHFENIRSNEFISKNNKENNEIKGFTLEQYMNIPDKDVVEKQYNYFYCLY